MAKSPSISNTSGSLESQQLLTPELTDLVSEFHLLKEVCHPNVVKLLGACTDSDGPFLLILEYCEHGSLRNYLRRSRLLPPDAKQPQQPQHAYHPAITPRDLLSFAWQIAQAGAYLAEMKVRHISLIITFKKNLIFFVYLVGPPRLGRKECPCCFGKGLQSFRFWPHS